MGAYGPADGVSLVVLRKFGATGLVYFFFTHVRGFESLSARLNVNVGDDDKANSPEVELS
jgi:hypothetical protein